MKKETFFSRKSDKINGRLRKKQTAACSPLSLLSVPSTSKTTIVSSFSERAEEKPAQTPFVVSS